jgi:hypothetical protein
LKSESLLGKSLWRDLGIGAQPRDNATRYLQPSSTGGHPVAAEPWWPDPTLRDLLSDHDTELSDAQTDALLMFLLTLDGEYPERPWSDWLVF